MRGLLIILGLALASASAHDAGLRVTFNVGFDFGNSLFYDIPRSMGLAVLQGWRFTERVPGPRASLLLFCPDDRVVCAFFDSNGIVSGLQVAVRQDEFKDSVFDWSVQGFHEWEPAPREGPSLKYWAITQFFVSEEYLQTSAESRRSTYDSNKLLQENAIWLNGFNGKIDKVGDKESDIKGTIYTEQGCIPWMGRHYYYNMSASLPCKSDTIYPWFPLVHNKDLVGTGLLMFGKLSVKDGERDWFERPPRLAVQVIVPRGPECLYDLAEDVGLVTIHIYYINKPWTMFCLFQ